VSKPVANVTTQRPLVPKIVRQAKGVSYGVQTQYANWQRGMKPHAVQK